LTFKDYLEGSRDLALNVLLVLPALVLYEVGVWVLGTDLRNGADLLLRELFLLVGRTGIVILNALVIASAVVCALDALKRYDFIAARFAWLGVECLGYAALLGPLVLLVRTPIAALALDAAGASAGGGAGVLRVIERIVLALGAGAYEELFFRLLLMGALFNVFFGLFREARWLAASLALVVSSVVFALCHHDLVLPGGEPFDAPVFLFRTLAGAVLGAVFYLRGFAAAVYTHAFYNLLVFLR